jgi:hypothetical protein
MAEKQRIITSEPLSPDEMSARTQISEDFHTVFSNRVRVAASATDFRLFFGETYPTATGEIKVIENFSVVVTPMQAKALSGILTEIIQKLEAQQGPIPVISETQTVAPPAETPQPATSAMERQD